MIATITNSGTTPLTGWAGGGVNSPFIATQDCNIVGGVLPGKSCHYYFTFSPTAAGTFSATSTSSTNAGQISVTLAGKAHSIILIGGGQQVSPLSLDYGPVGIGHSQQQIVTITNTSLTPLTGWAGGAVPAPFNGSQDCNISGGVLPGNSCHFFYTFSPTSIGSFSATSTFSTNAGTISIKLQGQGVERGYTSTFLPSIYK